MPSKTKKTLHTCQCESCAQHPYSRIAKEHKAINRVLLGLDERNKRRFVGVLANQQGNILQLSQITGLSRNTIYRGQNEVEHPSQNPASGIRQSGAGRLLVEKKQPGILKALEKILKDATAGDPITGLKWTRKTSRNLAQELRKKGFEIGHSTISRLARGLGYTLRGNRKRLSRKQDAGRDHQMRYLTRLRNRFVRQQMPVISVDCKKKELIGLFCKPGRTLRKAALEVLSTDFPSDAKGKANPYGIYDVRHNEGHMVVGVSHETAEFVIAAIRRWWLEVGSVRYNGSRKLLIQADSGGANACDSWLWKVGLQTLADEFQLSITVTHYPAGASKWNLIEHRMFSAISRNWAGQPLISYETMLKFIRTSKTRTGFRCLASFDRRKYQTKCKVSFQEKENLNLRLHNVFPLWNYTVNPHVT